MVTARFHFKSQHVIARVSARFLKILGVVVVSAILLPVTALTAISTVRAVSGPLHLCEAGAQCEIGEFLFDDNYNPITTASCTLTSRYPDGSLFKDGQAMTVSSEGDGWYSHEFTAPSTTGIYRSQICCTAGSDYLCLDKSFNVETSSGISQADVASAVWNAQRDDYEASGSFGEAIQNIMPSSTDIADAVWSYSTRTVSSFGDLVSNIWSHSNRSITGLFSKKTGGSTDVSEIAKNVKENRLLLEQLVNKPIIETFLEEEEDGVDLRSKLDETSSIADEVYVDSQLVRSKIGLLALRWSSLDTDEMESEVSELLGVLGNEEDSQADQGLFGKLSWLKTNWGFEVAKDLFDQARAIRVRLARLNRTLSVAGKTRQARAEVLALVSYVKVMDRLIGDVSHPASQPTLFGKIAEVKQLADAFDSFDKLVDQALGQWPGLKDSDKLRAVKTISGKVLKLNRLPKVRSLLGLRVTAETEDKDYKNALLAVKGVIQANRSHLARKAESPVSSTWAELGSIVFKSLVTNPSELISQSVPLKYYLPPEVREEDIVDVEGGLTVKYDAEKDQYFVEGEFTLARGESKTVSVKVQDIWVITESEIASLKAQAEELSKPLERTAFFAQGVTLKSDIDVSLDKILTLQETAVTPEQKIRNFREAMIELTGAKEKIAKLEDLVTQAASTGTLFGFVGGAQAIAVWGLIIIIGVGFVGLALYMKVLRDKEKPGKKQDKPEAKGKLKKLKKKEAFNGERGAKPHLPRLAVHLHVLLLTSLASAGVAAGATSLLLAKKQSQPAVEVDESNVLGEEAEAGAGEFLAEVESGLALADESGGVEDVRGGEDIVRVEVAEGVRLNLREEPSLESRVVGKISQSVEVTRIGQEGDWVEIVLPGEPDGDRVEGWVHGDFVVGPETGVDKGQRISESEYIDESLDHQDVMVVINKTETGWLRVRQEPWGAEIDKVYPGGRYNYVSEQGGWYQIELDDGSLGWVHGGYVSLE